MTEVSQMAAWEAEIPRLLYHEAWLLDHRQFETWLELFTADAIVWVPAGYGDPRHYISLVYDDRELMGIRVRRLRHPAAHSQNPPAQAARLVSNIWWETPGPGEDFVVHSTFVMVEARLGEQRIHSGHYEHHLRRVENTWRIAYKKVDLVNQEGVFANLGLPF